MFFDIGRRRVLIIVKYIIIMKKMQPLDGTVSRISDVTCFERECVGTFITNRVPTEMK